MINYGREREPKKILSKKEEAFIKMKKKLFAVAMTGLVVFSAGCAAKGEKPGSPAIVIDGQTLVLGKTTYAECKDLLSRYSYEGCEDETDFEESETSDDLGLYTYYADGLELSFSSETSGESANPDACLLSEVDIDNFYVEDDATPVNGTVDGIGIDSTLDDLIKYYGNVKGEYDENGAGLYSLDESYDENSDFLFRQSKGEYEIQYSLEDGKVCLIYVVKY
jgi:hypothetical protein